MRLFIRLGASPGCGFIWPVLALAPVRWFTRALPLGGAYIGIKKM
jgi:hypothetical protein